MISSERWRRQGCVGARARPVVLRRQKYNRGAASSSRRDAPFSLPPCPLEAFVPHVLRECCSGKGGRGRGRVPDAGRVLPSRGWGGLCRGGGRVRSTRGGATGETPTAEVVKIFRQPPPPPAHRPLRGESRAPGSQLAREGRVVGAPPVTRRGGGGGEAPTAADSASERGPRGSTDDTHAGQPTIGVVRHAGQWWWWAGRHWHASHLSPFQQTADPPLSRRVGSLDRPRGERTNGGSPCSSRAYPQLDTWLCSGLQWRAFFFFCVLWCGGVARPRGNDPAGRRGGGAAQLAWPSGRARWGVGQQPATVDRGCVAGARHPTRGHTAHSLHPSDVEVRQCPRSVSRRPRVGPPSSRARSEPL